MGEVVAISTQQEEEWVTWDTFWTLWPRRVARKEGEKAWRRLTPAQQQAAILALPGWRQVWAVKETQFIPHPSTWLNGERWEDELPAEFQRGQRVQAENQAFKEKMDKAGAERVPMPAQLRAMLDELKRKGR